MLITIRTGKGDERNFHAHILFTTRGFDPSTKDGWAKNKYRDLNNDKIEVDGESTTRGKVEVHVLRKFTADEMNRIAQRDKLQVKTEHLSFEARGLEKEPTQKMGYMATQLERRGIKTERGDINRAIIASNDNMGSTTAQLKDQKRVLLLEQQRALLALEQEEGNRFSGNRVTSLGRGEGSFPFHQKRVDQAQDELHQAKEQLEKMSLIDRMIGKKAAFEAQVQTKENNFKEAQRELDEIKRKETVQPMDRQELKTKIDEVEEQRRVTAVRTAQYKQEQGEEVVIKSELENRTNIEKIIGAITGKTKEQNARLEELQGSTKTYEADKRLEEIRAKQIEDMKRDAEAKERDQSRANDNIIERQEDVNQSKSVKDHKAEFLERMAKERAEKEQQQEVEKTQSVETQVEEARPLTPEEHKQKFMDRMQQEREQTPDDGKDLGRE